MSKPPGAIEAPTPYDLTIMAAENAMEALTQYIEGQYGDPKYVMFQVHGGLGMFMYTKGFLSNMNIPFFFEGSYGQDEWSMKIIAIYRDGEIHRDTFWSPGG